MQNILETLFYLHGGCYIMLYPFISWVDCDYWYYSFYLIGRIFLPLIWIYLIYWASII